MRRASYDRLNKGLRFAALSAPMAPLPALQVDQLGADEEALVPKFVVEGAEPVHCGAEEPLRRPQRDEEEEPVALRELAQDRGHPKEGEQALWRRVGERTGCCGGAAGLAAARTLLTA